MPKINFSDRTLRRLATTKTNEDFWDNNFSEGAFGIQVSKKGRKRFFLRYSIHSGTSGNTKRKRLTIGTYPATPLVEARRIAREAIYQIDQGNDPQLKRTEKKRAETVAELFGKYFEDKEGQITAGHLKRCKGNYRRHIKPYYAETKLLELSKNDVRETLKRVAAKTPTQSERLRALFLSAMNHGVALDIIKYNPLQGIPNFGNTRDGERYLSKDEIRLYLSAADSLPPVETAYFRLLMMLGMRSGELSRLEWNFVTDDKLEIPGTHQKNKRTLVIPLVGDLKIEILQLRLLTGRTPFLFPAPNLQNPRASFGKHKKKLATRMGVLDWVLHDIRRTVETHMRENGIASDTVAALLNHNTSRLQKVYDKSQRLHAKTCALTLWLKWLQSLLSVGTTGTSEKSSQLICENSSIERRSNIRI